tara:strand:+ start:426 stop:776 length:351 start_codon:yes stop_codon:yes gene_type:complete
MSEINNETDVDDTDVVDMSREAFEKLVGITTDVKYSAATDRYHGQGFLAVKSYEINDLYKMYCDGKQSRQSEIDQLRAELEKAKELLNDSCCYSHGEASFADECQWCSEVADLLTP